VLVCPACRSENAEEAKFCSACGRALEPVQTLMRSRPADREAPDLDVPPPKPRSLVPFIIGLVVLGGLVAVGAMVVASRPDPCQGKYVSQLYPYCVSIPEGWTASIQRSPTGVYDRLTPRSEDAAVIVRVGEAVPGITTEQYAEGLRTTQEAYGLNLGPPQAVEMGEGNPALAWQFSGQTDEGVIVQERNVVLVRNGLHWRVTLTGNAETFDEARPVFERLIQDWTFVE
jgi:hypothetical protein